MVAVFLAVAISSSVVRMNAFAQGEATGEELGNQQAGHCFQHQPPVILEYVELKVRDADGIALGDLTGNGKVDILASDGDFGNTMWFEQGLTWRQWTRYSIHSVDGPPGETEIEGNALGDFNGDGRLEAVSLDQPNGHIYLHQRGGDPRGQWRSAIIQDERPLVQEALVTDIDGDGRVDLVYSWEGRREGHGGIHWLKLEGDDPLNPAHWRDHVMTTHESAWWLAPRRVDLSGNGEAVDIVFTARALEHRNPGARPGLFWMEPPEDVARPWKVHAIDQTLPHPLHVDLGDLSGNGQARDIVVGGFDTEYIYWYEYGEDWRRHELAVPQVNDVRPDRVWNVKTLRFGGRREGIFAAVTGSGTRAGAWLYYEYVEDRFRPFLLRELDYHHPTDDRILLFDVTGDGQAELFMPDSGTDVDRLHILRLGRKR